MKKIKNMILTILCCAVFGISGTVFGVWLATAEPTNTVLAAEPYISSGTPTSAEMVHVLTAANQRNEVMTLPELFTGANTAVVAISTETTQRNFFGQVVTLPAAGSGFIVSADGYIVTNDHVIENATRITVMLYNGNIYPATVVGRYRAGDLAVLKIEAENLSFLTFGNSDEVMVGEQVAAIGNPLGELSNSMTVGHISGLDRDITIGGITLTMIQTDASVNSGNSGGPLLNLRGEVIGVVTARAGGSAGGLTVEGLGFAIPSNIAAETISRLIENGEVLETPYTPSTPQTPSITPPSNNNNGNHATNPFTGAPLRPLDPSEFGGATMIPFGITMIPQEVDGQIRLKVASVDVGSRAEATGVLVGDIIITLNGKYVSTFADFLFVMVSIHPNDVTLEVLRNNQSLTLTGSHWFLAR